MFDRNSRGPKIDSTKAKNELRKRKKITEACFNNSSAGFKFWTPTNKSKKKINSSEVILCLTKVVGTYTNF